MGVLPCCIQMKCQITWVFESKSLLSCSGQFALINFKDATLCTLILGLTPLPLNHDTVVWCVFLLFSVSSVLFQVGILKGLSRGLFVFGDNQVATLKIIAFVNTVGSPKFLFCDGRILVEKFLIDTSYELINRLC